MMKLFYIDNLFCGDLFEGTGGFRLAGFALAGFALAG
jgi:hypothetical protein